MSTEREAAWDRVVNATKGHDIDRVGASFDQDGRAWTAIQCSCGIGFTDSWEFTDHIRRVTFDAAMVEPAEPVR